MIKYMDKYIFSSLFLLGVDSWVPERLKIKSFVPECVKNETNSS